MRSANKPGAVIRIDLGGDVSAVARVLVPPLVEFYDYFVRSDEEVDLAWLPQCGVLFRIHVAAPALRLENWKLTGVLAVTENELAMSDTFFREDLISGSFFLHTRNRGTKAERIVPVEVDNCEGIERLAIWSGVHVEDRLRDHLAGRPCKWVRPARPVR